jgi:plasmid stabilization system protein ParE
MMVEKKPKYLYGLMNILTYIKNDKPLAAKKFENRLNKQICNLIQFPLKHRKSIYFDDENYRDLIYYGYTIIYKIENEKILILDIFKWQER